MYLIFAAHYNIRPCKAQYLYWYMEMLERFPDSFFVVNDDYLNPNPNRWEIVGKKKANPNFKLSIPKNLVVVPNIENMEDVKRRSYQNPSSILRLCVNQNISGLDYTLDNILYNNDIKAAFTCCNNRTLSNVCAKHNVPVIHNEQGTLRPPFFKRTTYIEFSGVNGNTEFYSRFLKFKEIANEVKLYSREELLRIVAISEKYNRLVELSKVKPTYNCGVALQVDVDTNMIAFNNGWTSADLINKAMKEHGKVLIRNHPLASMHYSTTKSLGNGEIDTSENSIEFISKCKKIMTINSSVAFEALLMGRDVEILGDSPFAQIPSMNEKDKLLALNFAVLSYLVPHRLWCNEEYYDFRIKERDEKVLYNEGQKLVLESKA